uniref:Uncharacterized protein n=1 Tax=Oryza meridionalis TaxID=40149 RepID=A0A0E0D0S9_9ORYZ
MAGETPPLALTLTELSMRIEEMGSGRLDGRRSLVVLSSEREPGGGDGVVSCHSYLRAQSKLREEKMCSECRFDALCVVGGIAVFAALCTMCYR